MKVALDADGVILRLHDRILAHLNALGCDVTMADFDKWDSWENGKFTKAQFYAAIDAAHEDIFAIQPYDNDTALTLWWLQTEPGIDPYVLTGKHVKHHGKLKAWLDYALWGHFEMPIATPTGTNISALAKLDHDWDILVDDCPKLVEPMWGDESRLLILMAAPWNKAERYAIRLHFARYGEWPDGVTIAHSWREVAQIIAAYKCRDGAKYWP